MYSWGYIKNATLNKLDLEEEEAEQMNLLSRFKYYANEAITQICSAIKPKRTFAEIEITKENVGKMIAMPDDFISFGHDRNFIVYTDERGELCERQAFDTDFSYVGYNNIICTTICKLYISYNARWITFKTLNGDEGQDNDTILDVPADILDCLPSYIASQCMKIDDPYKASELRNEYELMLARIDSTDYSNTTTFTIEGDW